MKAKSIALLVAAFMVVAAMGIGNAFAADQWWTNNGGYEKSQYVSSTPHAQWSSTISQTIDVNNGDILHWHNYWEHDYLGGGDVYPEEQWSSAGYAGSATYKYTTPISYYGTWYHYQDLASDSVIDLPDNWPTALNNNHIYETTGGLKYGTDFNTNQKFS